MMRKKLLFFLLIFFFWGGLFLFVFPSPIGAVVGQICHPEISVSCDPGEYCDSGTGRCVKATTPGDCTYLPIHARDCPSGFSYCPGTRYCCKNPSSCQKVPESITVPQPGEPGPDLSGFVAKILAWSLGIGGGIAFLLMLWGGLTIILSTGNPEKIKAGKEIITSAIAGLMLIIFAVFVLRLIGYDILGIPGFGK